MITALSAITLATHDMAAAVRFYRLCGFEMLYGGESASFTEDWYLLPHKFPAAGEQIDLDKLAAQVEQAAK